MDTPDVKTERTSPHTHFQVTASIAGSLVSAPSHSTNSANIVLHGHICACGFTGTRTGAAETGTRQLPVPVALNQGKLRQNHHHARVPAGQRCSIRPIAQGQGVDDDGHTNARVALRQRLVPLNRQCRIVPHFGQSGTMHLTNFCEVDLPIATHPSLPPLLPAATQLSGVGADGSREGCIRHSQGWRGMGQPATEVRSSLYRAASVSDRFHCGFTLRCVHRQTTFLGFCTDLERKKVLNDSFRRRTGPAATFDKGNGIGEWLRSTAYKEVSLSPLTLPLSFFSISSLCGNPFLANHFVEKRKVASHTARVAAPKHEAQYAPPRDFCL